MVDKGLTYFKKFSFFVFFGGVLNILDGFVIKNFQEKINLLKESNIYRELVESDALSAVVVKRGVRKFISFCSNDYFGLAHEALVKKAAVDAINKFGVGAGSSRYISGNNSLYSKLEKQIARMKNCDGAIVFSSGYQAAIGLVPALVGESDLVVADKLIHSCLLDGVKLAGARLVRFRHNDVKHCEELIKANKQQYQKILIITETVFSMDGDVGEVSRLRELARKNNCLLLTDAAHDIDFAGLKVVDKKIALKNSQNSAQNISKNYDLHLQMGTLSKAAGSLGGYVCGNKILIDYLRNFAKSAIYTTALPPAILAASLQSLKIIAKKKPGKKVLENAQYFCELMNLPQPQSAIVVIKIGDNKKVLQIAENIAKEGFLISAIRPPTVEPKGARLRITFSALHTKKQIENLVRRLLKIL